MIAPPTTFTTSCQRSNSFGPSYSTNIDTSTLQPVIAVLWVRQNIIFECCRRILHKAYACIIRGPNFLPPSLIRNINQFNVLHGDKSTNTPIECNR